MEELWVTPNYLNSATLIEILWYGPAKSGLSLRHSKTFMLFLLSHKDRDSGTLDHCPAAYLSFARARGHKQLATHCPSGFSCIDLIFINHGNLPKSWSSKAVSNHHSTTTILHCWSDVLIVECCVSFTSNVTGPTSSKKFPLQDRQQQPDRDL